MDLNRLLTWRGRLHGFVHNTLQLSSYELSDTSMRQYVKILNRFRPKLLISYPSPLAEFSRFLLDNRLRIPSITSIITSAEMLFDWQRELIGQAFDAPLFDRYGCREFGNIAHECEAHEGYHVNSERFVLEILDEDGHPVAPGESGNLYVTDLDNLGFPFLRYEIGDMARRSDAQCACGRGLPLIARLEGRSFDIVRCPDGGRVAGTFWTICLRRFPGVVRFQVVQERIDLLTIRLLTDDRYDRASEAPMTAAIQDKCGAGMYVRYEYVERIESTASGKQRFVVSRLQGA
jgi:phenylacetate-CoA ligase